jgi:hypothetical protein
MEGKIMTKSIEHVALVMDGGTFLGDPEYGVVRLDDVWNGELEAQNGDTLKKKLRNLIEGRKVEIKTIRLDKAGRRIAQVYLDGFSVNRLMGDEINRLYGPEGQLVIGN